MPMYHLCSPKPSIYLYPKVKIISSVFANPKPSSGFFRFPSNLSLSNLRISISHQHLCGGPRRSPPLSSSDGSCQSVLFFRWFISIHDAEFPICALITKAVPILHDDLVLSNIRC